MYAETTARFSTDGRDFITRAFSVKALTESLHTDYGWTFSIQEVGRGRLGKTWKPTTDAYASVDECMEAAMHHITKITGLVCVSMGKLDPTADPATLDASRWRWGHPEWAAWARGEFVPKDA